MYTLLWLSRAGRQQAHLLATNMHICMLTAAFPPDYSGASQQAHHLIKQLQRRGVECEVITRHMTNHERPAPGDRHETVNGIAVHRLTFGRERWGLPFSVRAAFFLWQRRRQIDLVHIHGIFWATYLAVGVMAFLGKSSIAKATQFGTDNLSAIRQRRFGWLQIRLLRPVGRLVAISSQLAEDYAQDATLAPKVVRIPNGVDLQEFYPVQPSEQAALRRQLNLPTDGLIISFAGIIKPRKGVDLLVEAWLRLAAAHPKLTLLLIGPYDANSQGGTVDLGYVAALRQRITAAGLAERVCWVGQVHTVARYLQTSDIFVLPSYREGLPNALLEAMACGLPCVASDLPSIQEVLREGGGLTFTTGNVDELVKHLSRLITQPQERGRYGSAAACRIAQQFSLSAVADNYLSLYQELVHHG
jgi:glycosyltransferase involved in cell wall biosynthesis